jgi:putative glycosyltransferase (TIGR04372 family)
MHKLVYKLIQLIHNLKKNYIRHIVISRSLIAFVDNTNYGHWFYEIAYINYLNSKFKFKKIYLIDKKNNKNIKREFSDQLFAENLKILNNSEFLIPIIKFYFSLLFLILQFIGLFNKNSKIVFKILKKNKCIFFKYALNDFKSFSRHNKNFNNIEMRPYFRRSLLEKINKLLKLRNNTNEHRYICIHYRENKSHELYKNRKRDETIRSTSLDDFIPLIEFFSLKYEIKIFGEKCRLSLSKEILKKIKFISANQFGNINQIELINNCDYFIGCESGPYHVAEILGKKTIIINATDPICSYPINKNSLTIMQNIFEVKTNKILTLNSFLNTYYYENLRSKSFSYQRKTSEQNLKIVMDILFKKNVKNEKLYEEAFIKFSNLNKDTAHNLKWGPDKGFLGNGILKL